LEAEETKWKIQDDRTFNWFKKSLKLSEVILTAFMDETKNIEQRLGLVFWRFFSLQMEPETV